MLINSLFINKTFTVSSAELSLQCDFRRKPQRAVCEDGDWPADKQTT